MSKCPPGVICVENVSFALLFIIVLLLGFFIYSSTNPNGTDREDRTDKENRELSLTSTISNGIVGRYRDFASTFFNGGGGGGDGDVLRNPYVAPQRNNNVFFMSVPMQPMQTNRNAVDVAYSQIGIMTPLNGTSKDNILPLMGRPLFTSRSKWNYYAISNQHNNVKLPISFKGKNALTDYGVDEIFSGDTVYVEGYNEPFKTTVYENGTMRYLPF